MKDLTPPRAGVAESPILWEPSAAQRERAPITHYFRWLRDEKGLAFDSYDQAWAWSVSDLEAFWTSIWEFFEIKAHRPYTAVLGDRSMPGVRWFSGAELNYAEHALRRRDNHPAIVFWSESGQAATLTYAELADQVAAAAAGLRRLGVGKGDRVAGFMSNRPETVIAFLATASIGAIWSCCSPDFGVRSVVERLQQIEPKVLFAVESYQYNGQRFDRRSELQAILEQLPTVETTVLVGGPKSDDAALGSSNSMTWEELVGIGDPPLPNPPPRGGRGSSPTPFPNPPPRGGRGSSPTPFPNAPPPRGTESPTERMEPQLVFEAVPFDHPLWVLYSSGTTGLPKAIVHGHGGILLDHFRCLSLQTGLDENDRFFWFTSTGWMMWNKLVSGLLLGCTIVLYDGSPNFPDLGVLWRLAQDTGITCFGTSAPYLLACRKAGLKPGHQSDLSQLKAIGSTGAPLPAEGFEWVYEAVKGDLHLGSTSGGTDVCTSFVGPCPILPVRAGELQCRYLGAKVEAFDEAGHPVIDEVGELVITEPLPSMPLFLWNDPRGDRYRESYFDVFPGVWRHGDWIKVTADGGCVIYGRSDSTLNRGGVRMGTSEFYRVVEDLPDVQDSLVVDTSGLGAQGEMLLFVVLREGVELDAKLIAEIKKALSRELSPRHVPNRIYRVDAVPRTLNGKKLEVPVKRILAGVPIEKAASLDAMSNPESIGFFAELAASRS